MKKKLSFIFFLISCCMLNAQDKSNRGKEFWLGYGNNISFTVPDYDGVNSQTMVLYITTEEAATVTVSVNSTSWSQTVNIPANSANVSVTLPKTGADDCRILNEGIFDKAIHIVSTAPVVVYAHQYNTQLSGATMLLPVETYGYTYYSVNFKQPQVNGWGKNWFYVIASEDNTRIEITPSDTTESGVLPGQTITVNLNKGQLYNVFGKISDSNVCDLTGSKVVSVAGADGNCHPVALFSGCSRFILCLTDGGEIAQQQIFPASAWGTRYLTYHSIIAVSNPFATPFINYYRVIVSDASTVVKRNGVVLTGLQRNRFYEFQSNSGDYIEADKPIIVGQYTPNSNQCTGSSLSPQGDPELMFLPSIEQGIKRTRVYNTKNANITVNYLTIIIPNNGIASLRVNGATIPASQRMVHPANSAYTIVARRLIGPSAQYLVESDSAFTAMIYGSGIFESYGYIAGTMINNLNSIGSIENVFNTTLQPDTFTCPKSPFEFTIKLAYRATSIQWLFSQVAGIAPARDTTISNPVPADSQTINGRKYFTYPLTGSYTFTDTGRFTIPVVYASPLIDHCSQSEKGFVTVVVKEGPVADFSDRYRGCTTDTAFFTGLADVNNYTIDKYTWRFDDNSVDTAINTFKKFGEGNHPVYLKVIADNGCVDDTTRILSTFPKPVARFGYNRTICIGDSVLLSDSSSITRGSIATWNWNFDDGNSTVRNNRNPFYHPYASADTFNITLVVLSDKGCASDTAFLPVPVNNKPQLSFTYTGKPCIDSSFLFTPVVTANGNSIQSGVWDFGDGQTQAVSNTNAVTHGYAMSQNNVPVKFILSGGSGCESNTAIQTISVIHPLPVAAFSISGNSFCPEKDIVFTYTGSDNIQFWSWDFNNGTSTAASPVSRKYTTGGNYPVTLTIQTTDGCSSAPATKMLNINKAPAIDAGPSILKIWNQPVMINAVMNDTGFYQYEWSPPGYLNNPAILRPTTNTPNDELYTIKVTGGPGNCEATDTVSVKVVRDLYIPNAFSPDNNGRHDVWNIPALNGNANARVSIYNRWGQKIFESRGYSQPWDGTYKGVAQPIGAYYYQVQPDANKAKVVTGFVMIVR
ncbi:MAG: gliding motility-associated C-terminal domain-containing protein [Chitinophagaceae bacterium]|nr:gliding motility-associated C-terminal domain-containing protein [Chitinophagaceae bacterium]